jgi:hypothetical protein
LLLRASVVPGKGEKLRLLEQADMIVSELKFLIRMGMELDMVISYTDPQAALEMNGIERPDMTITDQEFYDAGGIARIIDGKIFLGRTEAEKQAELDRDELERLKVEIASRDYRALKAFKLGAELDSLYPGESAWYESTLNRVHELEDVLGVE